MIACTTFFSLKNVRQVRTNTEPPIDKIPIALILFLGAGFLNMLSTIGDVVGVHKSTVSVFLVHAAAHKISVQDP